QIDEFEHHFIPSIHLLQAFSPLFFFHDTATPEIYTLSLHDALPIYPAAVRGDARARRLHHHRSRPAPDVGGAVLRLRGAAPLDRSEEHTSELQSRGHLVCRLLLEKKKHRLCFSTLHARRQESRHDVT